MINETDPQVRLRKSEITELRSLVSEYDDRLTQFGSEIETIRDMLINASGQDLSSAELDAKLTDVAARTRAIEQTLEIDPGEAIGLIRLRDQVTVLKDEVEDQAARVESEISRLYSIYLATVGALLVAVIAMVINNVAMARKK
ncbi:hypothetical protein [Ruegeria profundi]|uniref:hypothetical protein n=1 Tax=Ruegeria profundi TaxID=1685378 RepID=UPI003C7DED5C